MNAPARQMISVGIDIGTTTTQVIFSELTLVNVARAGQIPRVDIAARRVIYESEIVFTPLLDTETIDAQRLAAIIQGEYQKAGVSPAQVETGAVIITGETARKKNADPILSAVAGLAGDFVVTVAGPNVEGMIAGRGSGAASYSRQHFTTVTNVDIGGGSANSAVFRQGHIAASAAMNFGGRVVEIDPASGQVTHITPAGARIAAAAGVRLAVGDRPALADLRRITDQMAELTLHLIHGTTSPLADQLYQTPPLEVTGRDKPVMFSGGVGYYYAQPPRLTSVADVARHGDIGPLVAESLRESPALSSCTVVRPAETLRATVLGASAQTVTLSGSTIWAEESILPLKNVPVVRVDLRGQPLQAAVIAPAIQSALGRWDLNLAADPFAVALELDGRLDYPLLVALADGVAAFERSLPAGRPLIVIIRHDYAQALGQTVKSKTGSRPLLVIDQVGLEEGDYMDIGAPLMDGRVVPLVVKTLVFYH